MPDGRRSSAFADYVIGSAWLTSFVRRLMKLHALFAAMVLTIAVGCVHQAQRQVATTDLDKTSDGQLTKLAAIRAADRAVEAAGFRLSDYKEREAFLYENIHGWSVGYEPKVLFWQTNGFGIIWPTNRFSITVDVLTAATSEPLIPIPN